MSVLGICAREADPARLRAWLLRTLPRVGVVSERAFVCELRGTERLFGSPSRVARVVLDAAVRECGGRPSCGIASRAFVARIVAHRTAAGTVREVPVSGEAAFLAPLPLDALPLDPAIARELALLGIRQVGEFVALPRGAVLDRFGHGALSAHALASGAGDEEVRGERPPRRIGAVRRWDEAVDSRERLVFALRAVVDPVAAALTSDGLAAMRMRLILERDGAPAWRVDRALLPPAARAEALLRSLRWALDEMAELGPVVGASLEVTRVAPARGRQIGLFAPDGARAEEATAVAELLRAKLGPGVLLRARIVEPRARLPERAVEWTEAVG